MVRTTVKQSRFSVNTIYILAAVLSIIFLLGSVLFMRGMEQNSIDQINDYLEGGAAQSGQLIEARLANDMTVLCGAAEMLRDEENINWENVLPVLAGYTQPHDFTRVGMVDAGGNLYWQDEGGTVLTGGSFAEVAEFKNVLAGERVIVVGGAAQGARDEEMLFFLVPLLRDGEVCGALFAGEPMSAVMDMISTTVFGRKGSAQVIDKQGNVIIASGGSTGQNVLDGTQGWQREEILRSMSAGESGAAAQNFNGQDLWGAYAPLAINGWYVFYTVPESELLFNYDGLVSGLMCIVASAVALFVFFILVIRQMNRRSTNRLEEYAFIDNLTGQRTFQKFLLDAEKLMTQNGKTRYSLWYCDIKNFKYVNDILGYSVGDNVLKYWAMVLNQDTRKGEVFGRISADNFVCLREYSDTMELRTRFDLYAAMLENFNETAAQGFKLEMSAGIFLIEPDDKELTLNDMLDRANVAQKSIKNMSGSRCAIYSKEMRERILRETEMESRMEMALLNGEFKMYLQPRIGIQEGTNVKGAEALVRWLWPDKGLVPPDEFVPLFEKNAFIVRLDEFMLEQVCKAFSGYVDKLGGEPFTISVNVSRVGAMQPSFIERYVDIKKRYNIPDGFLELEFTESIAFENHELFRSIVSQLQQNGFSCALDDFGSGHSSLNILKNLPVEVLKIDRLFFSEGQDGGRDREVISSIISMARALSMTTVAEGIETKEQVEMLRHMGCDEIQGFVFARPMPEQEFIQFVRRMNDIEL